MVSLILLLAILSIMLMTIVGLLLREKGGSEGRAEKYSHHDASMSRRKATDGGLKCIDRDREKVEGDYFFDFRDRE